MIAASVMRDARSRRPGIALVAVLYFLVLAGLTSVAVVFGIRAALRRGGDLRTDAALVAAADAALYGALAHWNGPERVRQPVGTTTVTHPADVNRAMATLWVSRLGLRIFSLVAEVRSGSMARRVALLVRVPLTETPQQTALLSAVDVSIAAGARLLAADSGECSDSAPAALTLAPGVALSLDPAIPLDRQPSTRIDSTAADSLAYLRISESSWNELAHTADIRLSPDADLAPAPVVVDGACADAPSNWGEPQSRPSPCSSRAPLVYAPGDLTISGGRGQGVLLVDGRLVITGAFEYSGQIVVRRGIETRADAISISGGVRAWRAASESTQTHALRGDVVLTQGTTLRFSRCDAAHGVASWLQPRVVRGRAWTELF